MNIKWNRDFLLKTLIEDQDNINKKYTTSLFSEINVLRKLLDYPTVLEELEYKKNKYNLNNDINLKKDIDNLALNIRKAHEAYLGYPNINNKSFILTKTIFKIKYSKLSSKQDSSSILNDDMFKIIYACIDDESRFNLNKLLEKQLLYIENNNLSGGYTYYLSNKHLSLVKINNNGHITTPRVIAHELGHVAQYNNVKTFEELYSISQNNLNEVRSVLNELIFLDNLIKLKPKEGLIEKEYFINNYMAIIKTRGYDNYKYSFPIALYLFNLYKEDFNEYKKCIQILDESILKDSVSTIIEKMNVTADDMIKSYKKYIKRI